MDFDFNKRDDEESSEAPRAKRLGRGRVVRDIQMTPHGAIFTKAHLRDGAKFNNSTLDQFRREGAPIDVDTDGMWSVNLARFVRWYGDRSAAAANPEAGGGSPDGKRRKADAEAGLKEIELQKARSEVISMDDAAASVGHDYALLRSALLAIGARTAQQLSALTGLPAQKCQDIVDDEVNAALAYVSNHDAASWTPDVDSTPSGTT